MDNRWNVINATDPDPFKDETKFKKCQTDYEEAKIIKEILQFGGIEAR